jgi:hypothetical protein
MHHGLSERYLGIIHGWGSFVGPDGEYLPGVELGECELVCTVVSLSPTIRARCLSIRVYPLRPQVAEAKVRSGCLDTNTVHLLADDAHAFGLQLEYHCRSANVVEVEKIENRTKSSARKNMARRSMTKRSKLPPISA